MNGVSRNRPLGTINTSQTGLRVHLLLYAPSCIFSRKHNGPLPAWICRWSSQQLPCCWYCWWTVNQAILKEDRRRKFCACAYRDFPTASRGLNTSVTSELAQNAVGEHGRWVEKKKYNSEMRRWMKLCDRNFVKQHNQLFDKYVTGPWSSPDLIRSSFL